MVLARLHTRTKTLRLALLIGIIGIVGLGVGLMLPAAAPANPGIRKGAPPEAFKSGGARSEIVLREIQKTLASGNERSEKVLREIATTLQQIDTRLRTIERAVLDTANRQPTSRPANPNRR